MVRTGWILVGVLTCAAGAASSPRGVPGAFEARVDESWSERSAWYGPVPMYAFMKGSEESSPMISVERYGPDNPLYVEPKDYLARRAEDVVSKRAAKAKVMGRALPVVELRYTKTSDYFQGGPRRDWPMREQVVIVQDKKGFWVLSYAASKELFDKGKPAFDAFLSSFRLLESP